MIDPAVLVAVTERQYAAICPAIAEYGSGGAQVLEVAYRALREHHANGRAPLVELADLWAECLQEGRSLFDKPDRLWGPTGPAETLDLIGQTTLGPWQLTDWNIRDVYGAPYGVKQEWKLSELSDFCRAHPEVHAKMIADYIQNAYGTYGTRSPYGIQQYFWLEAYLKGEIGQGDWRKPVLVMPEKPGMKPNITPETMKQTGFYAKQILLGHGHNPHGLLFWLWVAQDDAGITAALTRWRDQKRWTWDAEKKSPQRTDAPGGFAVRPDDVKGCACHPAFGPALRALVAAVHRP